MSADVLCVKNCMKVSKKDVGRTRLSNVTSALNVLCNITSSTF